MTDEPGGYRSLGNRLQRVRALEELPEVRGRVVLVTGGTDGVGRALIDQLATTGATIVLPARDRTKGERVRDEARSASGNGEIHLIDLDLADLESVRTAAETVLERWDRLDVLIANAAHQSGGERTVTADGFETTFGVNHLAHALLVRLLEDRLKKSAPSRVIVVASEAHRRAHGGLDFDDLMMAKGPFRGRLAYNRSKLANILFARSLAERLDGSGVDVSSVHPGGVDTPMMRANFRQPVRKPFYPLLRRFLLISPQDSASGVLRVALDPALVGTSGEYFELGELAEPAEAARDADMAERLWTVTGSLLGDRLAR